MKQDDVNWVALAIGTGLSNDDAVELAALAKKSAWTVDEAERVVRLLWFRRGNSGFGPAIPLWTLLEQAIYVILKGARPPILQWFEARDWEKHDLINLFLEKKVQDKAATDDAGRGIHRGALHFFFERFLISVKRIEMRITGPLAPSEEGEGTEDAVQNAYGHLERERNTEPRAEWMVKRHETESAEVTAANREEFQKVWQAARIFLIDPTSWDFALRLVPATKRMPVARWLRFAMHFDVCREGTGENADPEHITSSELKKNIGMRSYALWSKKLGIARPQDPAQRIAVLRDSLIGLWIANVLGVPIELRNNDKITRIMRILCEVALDLDPKLLTLHEPRR